MSSVGMKSPFSSGASTENGSAWEGISMTVLEKQDAGTSAAIVTALAADETFVRLSKASTAAIIQRDEEDASKLQQGIQIGVNRGVLNGDLKPAAYQQIDVLGKSPDEVAQFIIDTVGEAAKTGVVIVLVGLSGTGKGTTVAKLAEKLPETVTWSNATWCESQGLSGFEASKALTSENLASFMKMLRFDNFPGRGFDIHINGFGLDMYVKDVQNTTLKGPKVSKNIPTVAEQIQGEAIDFAAKAIEKMRLAGKNVLLEGREQTVNYVPSPYRFCLTLSDTNVIGMRRTAQRIGASALGKMETSQDKSNGAVRAAVKAALGELS